MRGVTLNPSTQYATDANLRARQRLWEQQRSPFDLVAWVLGVAALDDFAEPRVLDVGCGNGAYVRRLRERGLDAVGCDLSLGMLGTVGAGAPLVNADVGALPFPGDTFDVVLAPHMLYHVDDRITAVHELRRVLAPAGRAVVVTNGADHLRTLRDLVETAVQVATPGWEMRSPATHAFSLENGAEQLGAAFAQVEIVRPAGIAPVVVEDPSIIADYVASVQDHYQPETTRAWSEVVEFVRVAAQRQIDETGTFVVRGETGAFVCS